MIAEALKGIISGTFKKVAIIVIFMLICIVPFNTNSTVKKLTAESADISNKYVSLLNEYSSDKSLAQNTKWLEDFDRASNELIGVNERAYDLNMDGLNDGDIYFYSMYSEASFEQIQAMEKIAYAIHTGDEATYKNNVAWFDNTIDEQRQAIWNGGSFYFNNNFDIIKNLIPNVVRFYFSLLGYERISLFLLVVGIVSIFYSVNVYIRKRKDLSEDIGFINVSNEVVEGETHKKYLTQKRRNLIYGAIGGIISIVITTMAIGVLPMLPKYNDEINTNNYIKTLMYVTLAYPADIAQVSTNGYYDKSEKISVLEDIIVKSIGEINVLKEWEDIPEDYQGTYEIMVPILEEMEDELRQMQLSLDKEEMFENDILLDYIHTSEKAVNVSNVILKQYGIMTIADVIDE